MRKVIFSILILLLCQQVNAQRLQYDQNSYGREWNRQNTLYLLGVPKDTFPVPSSLDTIPFLANKAGSLYTFNIVTKKWDPYSSGTGSSGITQVVGTNGLSSSNDSTVRLGGMLIDTTNIDILTATRLRFLANGINGYMEDSQRPPWLVFKSSDTIANNTYSSAGSAAYFGRDAYFTATRRDYHRGFEFRNNNKTADSTYLYSAGGDFGYGIKSGRVFTRETSDDTRSVWFGGEVDFDAPPNFIAWDNHKRPTGHTSSQRSRGWWAGIGSYLITNAADTVDYWIGFHSNSRVHSTSKVLKYYDFYGGGGAYSNTRVDSAWFLYSKYAQQRNYIAGPLALGGANTGPTQALELVGNFKHYNLRSSQDAADSMVVWNQTDKMYGKRPLTGAGLLFGRTDIRNNTGSAMSFSGADQDFTLDSLSNFGIYSTLVDGSNYSEVSGSPSSMRIYHQTESESAEVLLGFGDIRLIAGSDSTKEVKVDQSGLKYAQAPDPSSDSTEFKPLGIRESDGLVVPMSYWPGGSTGSSTNLANTDLTQTAEPRTFDHNNLDFYWENLGETRWYGSGGYSSERIMIADGKMGRWYGGRIGTGVYFEAADSMYMRGAPITTDTTGKYVTLQTTNDGVQKVRAGAFGGGGSTDGWLRAVVTTDFGLSDVNTAQTAFPSAIDQVTLESNSTYYFEFAFDMSVGNSSHATGMGFDLGSTTLNRFNMQVMGYPAVANNVTSLQTTSWWTSVTPNSAMMAASAVTGNHLRGWGYMSVNTGGDVTPQVIFSAAPGGTNLMKAGSYIHFRKVGDGSFTTNAGFK